MTGVVLAAGRGRRLQASDAAALTPAQRDAAARGLKVLMPVGPARRPLVDYVIARLVEAGCSTIVLVVPADHEALAGHLSDAVPVGASIRLAVQTVADGTAGAVAAAASSVDDDAFLVVNGDNLYPLDVMRALTALAGCGLAGFRRASLERESGFTRERVAAFAAIDCDGDGRLMGLREKPAPETLTAQTLVSMNLWRLDRRLFDACRDVALSPRGERELPDAVMLAVARGVPFHVVPAEGAVLDLTTAADVPAVTRALALAEVRA